jgi:hypothetical protein
MPDDVGPVPRVVRPNVTGVRRRMRRLEREARVVEIEGSVATRRAFEPPRDDDGDEYML